MPVTLIKVVILLLLLAGSYIGYEAFHLWMNYRATAGFSGSSGAEPHGFDPLQHASVEADRATTMVAP